MIRKLTILESTGVDPYENLATEEELLACLEEEEIILYLWQNENTVVIGRHQNAYRECNVEYLEQKGHIARRLSGGGAVYHDEGNLNFTFVVRKKDYSVKRQLEVILAAVCSLGIQAAMTGRNDLELYRGGTSYKFSGNAFYEPKREGNPAFYHHGTLLYNVDTDSLSKALHVSKAKLSSKGVASVKSRIRNLKQEVPSLTLRQLKDAMIVSAQKEYGCMAEGFDQSRINQERWQARTKELGSKPWIFGKDPAYTLIEEIKTDRGEFQIHIRVDKGLIKEVRVHSDCLDEELPGMMEEALAGLWYGSKEYRACIRKFTEGKDEKL